MWLKQSTAATLTMGPFVDATDGVTPETALSLTQAETRLSKNGGAYAQKSDAGSATHGEEGNYLVTLDATDTNTLGRLRVSIYVAGALPVWQDFMIVPANVWDSLFGADKLQVDAVEWLGNTIATPTVAGVPEVDVTHWLGTAAATPTVAGVPEVDVTHFGGTAGTFSGGRAEVNTSHVAGTAQTAGDIIADTNDIQARLPAALVGGRIDASVGAVATGAITAAAIADGAIDRATFAADTGLQSVRSNTAQAGAATSITLDASASATDNFYNGQRVYLTGGTGAGQDRLVTAYNGTTKVATVHPAWATNPDATSTFAIQPDSSTNLAAISLDGAAADNLELAADGTGYNLGAGQIVAASVTGAVGSVTGNVGGNVVGSVGSVTAAVTVGTNNDKTGYALSAAGVDAIWDEAQSGHTTAGTFGKFLDVEVSSRLATSGYTAPPTAAANADAVWDEAIADHVAAGSAGERVERLDIIASGGADGLTNARAVLLDNLDAAVTTRATPAQVNAEVVDCLNVDTYAEPASVPAATSTLVDKIKWLFALARNKITQTATTQTLRNDADSANVATSTVSDDGTTFTRGEFS